MPPHCDSLDGPVVQAAREAIHANDIRLVLPYLPEADEREMREIFSMAMLARAQGPDSVAVADRLVFETAVRLHRAGEGAAFEGLRPAGQYVGPVIPLAEACLRTGDLQPLDEFLVFALRNALRARLRNARSLANFAPGDVRAARAYVSASLGFQVFAHGLLLSMEARSHGEPEPPASREAVHAHSH